MPVRDARREATYRGGAGQDEPDECESSGREQQVAGGGDEGGRLIAEGPPLEIRRNTKSLTGRFLAGPRPPGEAGASPYNVTEIP